MPKAERRTLEKASSAARHCLDELPYRMVVFAKTNALGIPLYYVAGSAAAPSGAEKALRAAHKLHGGKCFYCRTPATQITIDHAEPLKLGGTHSLQNLLISCRPCNQAKGHVPIEAFKPEAGREWLGALLLQVQDRLNRL